MYCILGCINKEISDLYLKRCPNKFHKTSRLSHVLAPQGVSSEMIEYLGSLKASLDKLFVLFPNTMVWSRLLIYDVDLEPSKSLLWYRIPEECIRILVYTKLLNRRQADWYITALSERELFFIPTQRPKYRYFLLALSTSLEAVEYFLRRMRCDRWSIERGLFSTRRQQLVQYWKNQIQHNSLERIKELWDIFISTFPYSFYKVEYEFFEYLYARFGSSAFTCIECSLPSAYIHNIRYHSTWIEDMIERDTLIRNDYFEKRQYLIDIADPSNLFLFGETALSRGQYTFLKMIYSSCKLPPQRVSQQLIRSGRLDVLKECCEIIRPLKSLKTAVKHNQIAILEYILDKFPKFRWKALKLILTHDSLGGLRVLCPTYSPKTERLYTLALYKGSDRCIFYLRKLKFPYSG